MRIILFVLILFLIPHVGWSKSITEKVELYPIVIEKKWGYMNDQGKMVIKPQYEKADYFSEGLAPVMMDGQVGYIDKTGKVVIPARYDDGWAFKNGIAGVMIGKRLGYINKEGNFVWNPSN